MCFKLTVERRKKKHHLCIKSKAARSNLHLKPKHFFNSHISTIHSTSLFECTRPIHPSHYLPVRQPFTSYTDQDNLSLCPRIWPFPLLSPAINVQRLNKAFLVGVRQQSVSGGTSGPQGVLEPTPSLLYGAHLGQRTTRIMCVMIVCVRVLCEGKI